MELDSYTEWRREYNLRLNQGDRRPFFRFSELVSMGGNPIPAVVVDKRLSFLEGRCYVKMDCINVIHHLVSRRVRDRELRTANMFGDFLQLQLIYGAKIRGLDLVGCVVRGQLQCEGPKGRLIGCMIAGLGVGGTLVDSFGLISLWM